MGRVGNHQHFFAIQVRNAGRLGQAAVVNQLLRNLHKWCGKGDFVGAAFQRC
jgi:hypothetical protein